MKMQIENMRDEVENKWWQDNKSKDFGEIKVLLQPKPLNPILSFFQICCNFMKTHKFEN